MGTDNAAIANVVVLLERVPAKKTTTPGPPKSGGKPGKK